MSYLQTRDADKTIKRIGNIWYVSKDGNDTNDGETTGNAFLTIGHAVSQVSTTDIIVVGAGTYVENVVLNIASVTLDCEIGTVIAPSSGIGLVVSGGYNCIFGKLRISAVAGEAGVHIATNGNNTLRDVQVAGGATGFDIDTINNELIGCRAGSPTAFGFDIDGAQCKIIECGTIGIGESSVGYSIGSVTKGILHNCTSASHVVGGYIFATGSSAWTVLDCSSGAGDGKWLDIDDSNVWSNFSFADKLYHTTTLTSTGGDAYGSGPTAADGTHYNLFKVIGAVRVHALMGHVITQCAATSSTINIELTSEGGTVDITDSAGAPDLDAASVGTVYIRNSISTDPLDAGDPSTQPRIIEDTNSKTSDTPLPLVADAGNDTFITLVLSDAIASGELHWHIHWEPVTDEGIVTAV